MGDLSAVRRARFAVAALFLINGIVIGSWAAHIPLVEERLAISHSTLGVALFAMALGALVAMPLTGAVVARLGSALVVRITTPLLIAALFLPILAPGPLLLMLGLFVFGALNGAMDVSMNAHGVAVEGRLKRPVMSSFHGMWSLGGLLGAGIAALLLPVVSTLNHVALAVAALLVAAPVATSFLLPAIADGGTPGPAFALPTRATMGLGALCFLAMTTEGAVMDWAALHLRTSLDLGAGLAASGFAAFSAAMATGRFLGDPLRSHFGGVAIVRGGAVLAGTGLAVALVVPQPVIAILGFALVGIGLANLVPIFFAAAGNAPGQSAGAGIAALATIGYTGFLVGPPVIGLVADATTLAVALGLLVLACAAMGAWATIVAPAREKAAAEVG
jgi:hypothetical protein